MLNEPTTHHHHTPPYWMSRTQKTAFNGELWTANALRKNGYEVEMYPDFFQCGKDLLINSTLPCEVKTATQGTTRRRYGDKVYTYPYWKWNLGYAGNTNYLLILLAVDALGLHYPFIIPAAWMIGRSHFTLSNHPTNYGGIIAPGLNNWSVVDYLLNERYRDAGQLDLFAQKASNPQ